MTSAKSPIFILLAIALLPAICRGVAEEYIAYSDPYGAYEYYQSLIQSGGEGADYADHFARLGWIEHYFWGENETALKHFQTALSYDAENEAALEGLAVVSMLSGDMGESLRAWLDLGGINLHNPVFPALLLNMDFFANTTPLYESLPEELSYFDAGEDFWLEGFRKIKLAQFLYERGDAESLAEVAKLSADVGYWRSWEIVGPFRLYGKVDIYHPFPPEEKPGEESYGSARNEMWLPAQVDIDGYMLIDELTGADEGCVYLRTGLYSESEQRIYLCLDANCALVVWAGGELVYERNSFRDQRGEYEVVAMDIGEGVTPLLVKCLRNSGLYYLSGNWSFGVRVIDEEGKPLGEEIPQGADIAPKPKNIEQVWEGTLSALTAESTNPFDYFYRSLTALVYGYMDTSIALAERAVELSPAYPFFRVMLAYIYIASGFEWQLQAARNQLNTSISLDSGCVLAQEELAVYYKSEDKQKQALEAYRATIELNPEYVSARLGLADLLLSLHYEREYMEQIVAIEELYPENPNMLTQLYTFYNQRGIYSAAETYCRRYLDVRTSDRDMWANLAYLLEDAGDLEGAMEVWRKLLTMDARYISYYVELGRIQERRGDLVGAEETYHSAIEHCPYSHKGYQMLGLLKEQMWLEVHKYCGVLGVDAQMLGLLKERMGLEEEAIADLLKAKEMNPSDLWLDEYLRTTQDLDTLLLGFEVDAGEVLKDRVREGDYPGADAVILLNQLVVEVHSDYTFTETFHKFIQIMNPRGREMWGEFSVPSGAGVTLLEARTFLPDGGYLEASSIKDIGGSTVISLEGLVDGSVIEVKYRNSQGRRMVDDLSEFFSAGFAFCEFNDPCLRNRYVVILPEGMEIGFARNKFKGKHEKVEGEGRIAHIFVMNDVDGIIFEPLMPIFTEVAPQIQPSTIKDPTPLIEWYRGEMWGLGWTSQQVKERVRELCAGKTGDLERAKVIYYWVMHSIKGYGGSIYYPYEANQTFYSKQGRPIDRAVLIMAMLSEVGIDSQFVLLSTSEQLEGAWKHPNSGIFDTCLVYLPDVEGEEYYLDVLIGDLTFGDFWSDAYGRKAAFIKDDGFYFDKVLTKPLDRDYTGFNATLEIGEDGGLQVEGSHRFFGLRGSYRGLYRDPRDRDMMIESMLTYLFSSPTLEEVEFFNLDDVDELFYYTFRLTAPNYAKVEGEELVFSALPGQFGLTSAYVNSKERRWPLKLTRTETMRDSVVVKLPPGFEVVSLPPDLHLKEYFGEYELSFRQEGGGVYIERYLHLNRKTIKVSDYDEFINFCARVDEAEKGNIRIKPEGSH